MKKIISALLVCLLVLSLLPVTAMAAGETYTKISSLSELTTGTYVMITAGYAPTVYNNKWVEVTQPTVSGDQVTDTKGAVWTITVNGSSVTLKDSKNQFIKPSGSNTNGITTGEYSWTVACNNGTFTFAGSSVKLAANKSSSYKMRAYKDSTINGNTSGYPCNFTLYKLTTVETGCTEHTPEVLTAVAPTCTATGLTEGSKCSNCGTILVAQEEVAKIAHDFVEGVCSGCRLMEAPEADTALTLEFASKLGASMESDNYTTGKYYVTGVITSIANTTYGNLTIQDETGSLYIYGLYSEDGKTRYDAMENKPVVGDTVTLYGVIGNYGGTAQMKSGYMTAFDPACDHVNTTTVTGAAATCTETGLTEGVVCADCGFVITAQDVIPALGHSFDEDGECVECGALEGDFVPGYYLVTDAADLKVGDQIVIVAAGSDIALSTTQNNNNRGQTTVTKGDGTVEINDNVQVLTLENGKEAGTFAFNTGSGYLYAASSSSNHLKTKDTLDANGSWLIEIAADGKATVKAQGTYTRNWMRYNKTSALFACYGSGQEDIVIYKYETGEVEVECDHDSVAQDDALAPTCTAVGYTATEKCSKCGETTKFAEEIPALGHSYVDNFCNVCKEWTADSTLTIPQATEMGLAKGHNNYTEGKYYMVVIVEEVYNTQYGNINVVDAEGNKFVIYGTYSADGENSYAEMETKPVAGDIITVYGIIGQYKETAQMKNGWIIKIETPVCEHTNTTELADGKEPTCTETGLTKTVVCADCGEVVTAQTEIPAYGHAWVEQEELAPTCIHTGHLAHFECCVCLVVSLDKETLLTKEEVQLPINPDAHAWDEGVYTEATTEADAYTTYTCGACGATDVTVHEGTMIVGPAITVQPQTITVDSGETVQFSVAVTGGEVVSYKWEYSKIYKFFNTSMTGYDTDTLTVPAIGNRNNYGYRCVVTFADGTVLVSDTAKLYVNTVIEVTDDPNDQTVVLGYKGQFTVEAVGEGLKYQWEYKRPDGERWNETSMEGATNETVMILTETSRDGYAYRCKITDVTGQVTYSGVAIMRVLSFTSHPVETFAATDDTVTFTVATSVADGFTYQWQYRRSATGSWSDTGLEGNKTATLKVPAKGKNGYEYRCVLTGSKNSKIESKGAVLHVGEPVVITAQPQSVTVSAAENAVFTVEATNVYSYQWMYSKNGTNWYTTTAEGNKTATLSVEAKGRNGYQYRCHITGQDGTVTITEAATLTVG